MLVTASSPLHIILILVLSRLVLVVLLLLDLHVWVLPIQIETCIYVGPLLLSIVFILSFVLEVVVILDLAIFNLIARMVIVSHVVIYNYIKLLLVAIRVNVCRTLIVCVICSIHIMMVLPLVWLSLGQNHFPICIMSIGIIWASHNTFLVVFFYLAKLRRCNGWDKDWGVFCRLNLEVGRCVDQLLLRDEELVVFKAHILHRWTAHCRVIIVLIHWVCPCQDRWLVLLGFLEFLAKELG